MQASRFAQAARDLAALLCIDVAAVRAAEAVVSAGGSGVSGMQAWWESLGDEKRASLAMHGVDSAVALRAAGGPGGGGGGGWLRQAVTSAILARHLADDDDAAMMGPAPEWAALGARKLALFALAGVGDAHEFASAVAADSSMAPPPQPPPAHAAGLNYYVR